MSDSAGNEPDGYRPLTEREREILDFLLAAEPRGVGELRKQAEVVRAKQWDCGCASIDLLVDRRRAPRSPVDSAPAVEANTTQRVDPLGVFDLLLWVDEGWLSAIEIVEFGFERHEDSPDVFPPQTDFEPAFAYRVP